MRELMVTCPWDGGEQPPECRLTVTRKSFVEKISIHVSRLQDRLIEYVKYQLYTGREHRIDPVRYELLYDFTAGDGHKLPFLVMDRESGRATAAAHIPMKVYSELAEMFLPGSALAEELNALFPGCFVSVERLL
jgi:hypothetical protein